MNTAYRKTYNRLYKKVLAINAAGHLCSQELIDPQTKEKLKVVQQELRRFVAALHELKSFEPLLDEILAAVKKTPMFP